MVWVDEKYGSYALNSRGFVMKGLPFRFWVGVAALLLIIGLQFYLVQTASPESNARLVSWVRESPAWQFYGFIGLVSIPFLIAMYIMVNQKQWSRVAMSKSIHNANKVALSLWRVNDSTVKRHASGYTWVMVEFCHYSWGNRGFLLPVRPGHPDIDQFSQLKAGDTVEFKPLSEGMECALEHELCGYLRIKSVSR